MNTTTTLSSVTHVTSLDRHIISLTVTSLEGRTGLESNQTEGRSKGITAATV